MLRASNFWNAGAAGRVRKFQVVVNWRRWRSTSPCPVYPGKQTPIGGVGISAGCQQRQWLQRLYGSIDGSDFSKSRMHHRRGRIVLATASASIWFSRDLVNSSGRGLAGLRARHNLVSRTRTGRRRQRRLSLRHRYDPGFCGWWLVSALQTHAQQFGAHGVATLPYAACDLPGTVAIGPEFSEKCNARGIPHALLSYTESVGADNITTRRVNFARCCW